MLCVPATLMSHQEQPQPHLPRVQDNRVNGTVGPSPGLPRPGHVFILPATSSWRLDWFRSCDWFRSSGSCTGWMTLLNPTRACVSSLPPSFPVSFFPSLRPSFLPTHSLNTHSGPREPSPTSRDPRKETLIGREAEGLCAQGQCEWGRRRWTWTSRAPSFLLLPLSHCLFPASGTLGREKFASPRPHSPVRTQALEAGAELGGRFPGGAGEGGMKGEEA